MTTLTVCPQVFCFCFCFLGRRRRANCLSGSPPSSVIDVRRAIAHCMVLGTSIPSAPGVRDASIPFNYRVIRQPVRAIANTSVTRDDAESTKSLVVRPLAHVWCNG
ncbi:MAG TPA: hypothetical protein V6D20_05250 [Candidatus Obscuribacterales bacterium]